MGILPLKKRVNRDKCSFTTKQRMFGVFAIDEILRYRGTRFPGSRTLCHPGWPKFPYHSMYDVAGNGYIDLNEMTQIVKSIYHLIGRQQVQFILLFLGINFSL